MSSQPSVSEFIQQWARGTLKRALFSAVSNREGVLFSYDEPIAAKHPSLANVVWVTARIFSVSTNRHTYNAVCFLRAAGMNIYYSLEVPKHQFEWSRLVQDNNRSPTDFPTDARRDRALKYVARKPGGAKRKSPVPMGWWAKEMKRRRAEKRAAEDKETLSKTKEW